jgi:hypothetical protein
MTLMTRSTTDYIDSALNAFNAGFSSKSSQQSALGDLSRAYDLVKEGVRSELLRTPLEQRSTPEWKTLYWDLPDYIHNWKPKHSELFARFPEAVRAAEELVELRATIKAAEVVPPAKDLTKVRATKVLVHLKDLMERRQAQYLEAIDLTEVLGKEGVIIHGLTANSHYVTNEHGTTFLRTFFYLRGKLTPLNSILAGAEEATRRVQEAQ